MADELAPAQQEAAEAKAAAEAAQRDVAAATAKLEAAQEEIAAAARVCTYMHACPPMQLSSWVVKPRGRGAGPPLAPPTHLLAGIPAGSIAGRTG